MEPYYEDDLVTLYLGDCLAHDEWLAGDVLVMDPPYGINWKIGNHLKRGSVKHDGIANDGDTLARDRALAQFGNRPGIVFGSWRAPAPTNVAQTLVWRKPADAGVIGSTTGFRLDTELIFLVNKWPKAAASRSSVLTTDPGKVSYLNGHPHAKPVALMQTLIEATPPGVIVDPFAGSGSTLVAASSLGRRAIGVELDERYCELIAKRLGQQSFDFGEWTS